MIYNVTVSVSIMPKDPEFASNGNLYYHRQYALEGDRFTDIAAKIDLVSDAIGKGLTDDQVQPVRLRD